MKELISPEDFTKQFWQEIDLWQIRQRITVGGFFIKTTVNCILRMSMILLYSLKWIPRILTVNHHKGREHTFRYSTQN
jgi:hypothetical protein